jgi:single-stranded DNA-binding protein
MLIAVEGRISQNSYEKDGTKYNSIEVIADKIEYLDKIKHEVNDIKEADLKTITQSDIQLDLTDNLPF